MQICTICSSEYSCGLVSLRTIDVSQRTVAILMDQKNFPDHQYGQGRIGQRGDCVLWKTYNIKYYDWIL